MNQRPHRWNLETQTQRRHENNREMANIGNAYYDGDAFYAEYSKAISDFLKDPVSLGIMDVNSPRGLNADPPRPGRPIDGHG